MYAKNVTTSARINNGYLSIKLENKFRNDSTSYGIMHHPHNATILSTCFLHI
jgi:hypothetical protein